MFLGLLFCVVRSPGGKHAGIDGPGGVPGPRKRVVVIPPRFFGNSTQLFPGRPILVGITVVDKNIGAKTGTSYIQKYRNTTRRNNCKQTKHQREQHINNNKTTINHKQKHNSNKWNNFNNNKTNTSNKQLGKQQLRTTTIQFVISNKNSIIQ